MGFEVSGMDATITRFERAAARSGEAVKKAVKAGGKALALNLAAAAPVDTGALANSIKPGTVKHDAANGYYCEVKPTGDHPVNGEPLAKIGNILKYGRSNMPPDPWFNPTVEASEGEVLQVMDETLAELMEGT